MEILIAVLLLVAFAVALRVVHDQAFESGARAYRDAAETFMIEYISIRTADRILELADASLRIQAQHPHLRQQLVEARKGAPIVIHPLQASPDRSRTDRLQGISLVRADA